MDDEELRNQVKAFLQQKLDQARADDPESPRRPLSAQLQLTMILGEFVELKDAEYATRLTLEVLEQHFVIVEGPTRVSTFNWILMFTDEGGERWRRGPYT
jgi:hypothetical protein